MKTYTTISGDTFDKIALEQLGSEYLFPLLLSENPKYRNVLIFSGGIILNIPDFSNSSVYSDAPEWLLDNSSNDTDTILTKGDDSDS